MDDDARRRPFDGRPSARSGDPRPSRPRDGRVSRPADDDVVRPRTSIPPVPNGPRTAMAPFQAVPAPEAQPDKYSPEQLASGRSRGDRGVRGDRGDRGPSVLPNASRPSPAPEPDRPEARGPAPDEERFAPWSTGPSGRLGQAAPPPPPSASYGDWTRPSRDRGRADRQEAPAAPGPRTGEHLPAAVRVPAPMTSAIPERHTDDRADPPADADAISADRPRGSSPRAAAGGRGGSPKAVGNRAALRAQRQAAEADRLKAARERLGDETLGAPSRGGGRRLITALVAVAVVALGVLGVYSFTSPHTKPTSHSSAAGATNAAAPSNAAAPVTETLPPLVTGTPSVVATPASPVRAPVTVLNATNVTGLAAKIAATIGGGGWQTTGVGAYTGKDVAVTTVYFTQGDETQRQAAQQLVSQFPQVQGPAPRFFDVPNNPTPGLVVVATGDWRP